MDNHAIQKGVKVQRFCLTLVGEARSWYEPLRSIAEDWNGLQAQFRQQYLRIGNTREQLFHLWRSFHFDENPETIDSYSQSSSTPSIDIWEGCESNKKTVSFGTHSSLDYKIDKLTSMMSKLSAQGSN